MIYSNSIYDDNKNNRKSIYDYVLLYEYEVYIWISKKQCEVTTSIIEFEYIILTQATKIVM